MASQREENDDLSDTEEVLELADERCGNIFIVEMSPSLFDPSEVGDDSQEEYWKIILDMLDQFIRDKMAENSSDMFGLMLTGIQKDTVDQSIIEDFDEAAEDNAPPNSIFAINLNEITADTYHKLTSFSNQEMESLNEMISNDSEFLSNALKYAIDKFNDIKLKMPTKRIILITCDDNPASNDKQEQNNIRLITKELKNLNIKLEVIGLTDGWNKDIFYNDIEILAGVNREKKSDIMDLLLHVFCRSQTIANLNFYYSDDKICPPIPVCLKTLYSRARYLKNIRLNEQTNEPLATVTNYFYYKKKENGKEFEKCLVESYDGSVGFKIAGRIAPFKNDEKRKIHQVLDFGLYLHEIKPFEELKWYLVGTPQFLIVNDKASDQKKDLFYKLLKEIEDTNSMMVCHATFRTDSTTYLYYLQPHMDKGGFYVHKIPYKEDVRSAVLDLVNEERGDPSTDEQCKLMLEFIKAAPTCKHKSFIYSHPKRSKEQARVESIALKLKTSEETGDDTEAPSDLIQESLQEINFYNRYNKAFAQNSQSDEEKDEHHQVPPSLMKKVRTDNDSKGARPKAKQVIIVSDDSDDSDDWADPQPSTSKGRKIDESPKNWKDFQKPKPKIHRRHSTKRLQSKWTEEEAIGKLTEKPPAHYTNDELRDFSRAFGLKTNGLRKELVQRIEEYLDAYKKKKAEAEKKMMNKYK